MNGNGAIRTVSLAVFITSIIGLTGTGGATLVAVQAQAEARAERRINEVLLDDIKPALGKLTDAMNIFGGRMGTVEARQEAHLHPSNEGHNGMVQFTRDLASRLAALEAQR